MNEELDEISEEEIIGQISEKQHRIVLIQLARTHDTLINRWLQERQQIFYYQRNYGDRVLITLLLEADEVDGFCCFVQENFPDQEWLISIGEETDSLDKILKHSNKRKTIYSCINFMEIKTSMFLRSTSRNKRSNHRFFKFQTRAAK